MKTKLYTKPLVDTILNEITDYIRTNNETYDTCKNKISKIIAEKFAELRPDADIDTQTENTDDIQPVNEISIDTTAGTLVAYIDTNDYGPEIGIMHKTADGTPTDLFSANVACSDYIQQHTPKEYKPKTIHAYIYEDPYAEDYTTTYDINSTDIMQALSGN